MFQKLQNKKRKFWQFLTSNPRRKISEYWFKNGLMENKERNQNLTPTKKSTATAAPYQDSPKTDFQHKTSQVNSNANTTIYKWMKIATKNI